MLTKEKKLEFEILEICKNSGDIEVGDRFDGFYGYKCYDELYDRSFLCIGKRDNVRLFTTMDKLYYFTVSGGWGEKDGKLVAIEIYGMLHFKVPSGADELRNYISSLKPATGYSSAMLRQARIKVAENYLEALQKFEEE